MTSSLSRRAGPLFGVVLVIGGVLAAFTPTVPSVRANDPSPAPSEVVDPTPDPTPEPTADPTAPPTPEPDPTSPPDPDPTSPPDPDPTGDPGVSPDPSADPSEEPSPTPEPSGAPGPVRVGHAWINTEDGAGRLVDEGALDEPLTGAQRFTVYVARFQLVNKSTEDLVVDPALEVRLGGDWVRVPEVDPVAGVPFYAASDDGRRFRVRDVGISVAQLRLGGPEGSTAVAGMTSAGVNPLRDLALAAGAHTEVEFAIRATTSADWKTRYDLRMVDGRTALAGVEAIGLEMGARPEPDLSAGQQSGRGVKDPVPLYRLDPTIGSTDLPNTAGTATATGASYALRGPLAAPGGGPYTTPHVVEGLTSDTCGACHATHSAQAPLLFREPEPTTGLCFSCHDGSGAVADVMTDWTASGLPANDPATGSWYSHPATSESAETHVPGEEDEFGGALNRHAACADCHQPHLSDDSKPVNTTGGWTASGPIKGASGVAVTNGAAGTAPAYTLTATSQLEYQLCFKCHSGYTQLPGNDGTRPSRWALDKAIEFNPANVSYHPVEAPGKNQSPEMAASLAGTSPYKLWNFEVDETVRCLNCHGDSSVTGGSTLPAADSQLDNHAGPNRGLLIAPYRDRELKPRNEPYQAEDFALCFVCHAEEPMVDGSGSIRNDTNFNWHGFHLTAMSATGTGGTDIDTFGAGQGNATCSECHFRTHSSALAVGGQAPAQGLVNFAPNVSANYGNGIFNFSPRSQTSWGSCTLTCHGKNHNAYSYAEP